MGIWLTLLAFLAACQPAPAEHLLAPWTYSDVRWIDPVDSASPTQDIVALYTRSIDDDMQIRLDFLEQAPLPDYDVYVVIDHSPGGRFDLPVEGRSSIAWDTLLAIPANKPSQVLEASGNRRRNTAMLAHRYPPKDVLTIAIKKRPLGDSAAGFKLQVFVTPAENKAVVDQTEAIHTLALPPPPAQILFAFWDVYPASTPATALRRWDGAHTGPFGGRHGLGNLLRVANASQIPLVLLDLKNPNSLAALQFIGKDKLVSELQDEGLVVIPDYVPPSLSTPIALPDPVLQRYFTINRSIAEQFDFVSSPFAYSATGNFPALSPWRFTFAQTATHAGETGIELKPSFLNRRGQNTHLLIPSSAEAAIQAEREKPSLQVRQATVQMALENASVQAGAGAVLVLGGSLPTSSWGDPQAARSSFDYLKSRPWIRILNSYDLLALRPAASQDGSSAAGRPMEKLPDAPITPLLEALQNAPENTLGRSAWLVYQSAFTPHFPASEKLAALRQHYLGDVWSLLTAAKWEVQPANIATCESDPDHDGQAECVLASANIYAQIEASSGALDLLIIRSASFEGGTKPVHQIIAPSSQFISGLSDPSTWNLQGAQADPSVLPGGFSEPEASYHPSLKEQSIVLSSGNGQIQKIYRLNADNLEVAYHFSGNPSLSQAQFILALDPWQRFTPGWANDYRLEIAPSIVRWFAPGGSAVEIRPGGNASLSATTFKDSIHLLGVTEDPNKDYPPGHYLPFPLALLKVKVGGDFAIQIRILR